MKGKQPAPTKCIASTRPTIWAALLVAIALSIPVGALLLLAEWLWL